MGNVLRLACYVTFSTSFYSRYDCYFACNLNLFVSLKVAQNSFKHLDFDWTL